MKLQLPSENYVDFIPFDDKKRDLILIMPGGGYEVTSWREGPPVADAFRKEGFHTAVYWYRQTKLKHPEVHQEGELVLEMLKKEKLVKRIFVCGFSAGGHLAATLMVTYPKLIYGGILGYPVIITDMRFSHPGSFLYLLGDPLTKKRLDEVSIEKHVTEKTPPTFLFHTMDDTCVPVENSQILLGMLRMKRVKAEGHFYASGRHGFSLATKEVPFEDMTPDQFVKEYGMLSGWFDLAIRFIRSI